MSLTQQQARANLTALIKKYSSISEDDRTKMTEASVVRQFIDILLRDVLGWPIEDPQRYKYELHTGAGRPDITLFPEQGGTIFVEAKRFNGKYPTVIKNLELATVTSDIITPGQLALPGMSVDRTPEEQQAINYAFKNDGTWAILTNFQKLRLFNARRDWLVLAFERPGAMLEEFDLLWQLSYDNILNGSLDMLSEQRYREEVDRDYLIFINQWREKLAIDLLQNPAKNAWLLTPAQTINLPLLRSVVQQFLDRLVVIRFAEDHLVVPADTMRQLHDVAKTSPYTFTMHEFLNRFFRQFDARHNSSLFARSTVDSVDFSDEVLMPLINKLYEARYRAMPADILGNTYEQYLGKALVIENDTITTRDNLETRKKQGSYYTPQVIVRHIVDNSLGRYLYGTHNGKSDGNPLPDEARKTADEIGDLRVLDSACGSGSFLIYAYYVLADFYRSEIARLQQEKAANITDGLKSGMSPLQVEIAAKVFELEIERIENYPRLILEHHLYGVDLDPQAAEIAVVNLMMRAMERKGKQIDYRLPLILNQNVKVGNGLIGVRHDDPRMDAHRESLAKIRALRQELIGTPNTDPRHDDIVHELRTASDTLEKTLNTDFVPHFSDIERVRPFHWGMEFPEVFYDAHGQPLDNPGFQVVIGNPPWEIVKPDLREFYAQFDERIEGRMTRTQAEKRITELEAEDPSRKTLYEIQKINIEEQAAYYKQSDDYTRQYRGDTATHKLFMERMYGLLAQTGRLGYLVPSGIYTDLGTKDLREMLFTQGNIQSLISLTNGARGGFAYFPDIHRSFKIALIVAERGVQKDTFQATFRIDPRNVPIPEELPIFATDPDNFMTMNTKTIQRFSPDSLSIMEFQSRADYDIAAKIYDEHPLLGDDVADSWNVKFTREFDMTNDRRLFNTAGVGLPLYTGRMFHQFDAYFAEPELYVEEAAGRERLTRKTGDDYQKIRLVYRDIASSTNERSLISAIIPANTFCNNKAPVLKYSESGNITEQELMLVCSLLNSYLLDFLIRQKISATLNFFYMNTLPLPRLQSGNRYFDAIVPRAARLTCTTEAFAGLWQDVMGSAWDVSNVATDAAERQTLRDELDAIIAHLYGLSRTDFDHILKTFPLVFPMTDEGTQKRAALLETYDSIMGRV